MRARWEPIGIGLLGGLAAGLLGVGGGIVVVPLLVANLGLAQRRAHATSLAAIAPAAAVGALVYANVSEVSWPTMGWLAIGAVIGAPLGVRVLSRSSDRALAVVFLAFSVLVGLRLLIT
jgi:uncharacterized membrane protein YfcA